MKKIQITSGRGDFFASHRRINIEVVKYQTTYTKNI